MPKSNLNRKYEFDTNIWVVSVFNSGGFFDAHAILLVEGLKGSVRNANAFLGEEKVELFVGQYDIVAPTIGGEEEAIRRSMRGQEEASISRSVKEFTAALGDAMQNQKGIISNIKVFEGNKYTRDGGYERFRPLSWSYFVSRDQAELMIEGIHQKSEAVKEAWRTRNFEALPKYQFRGQNHPFGDSLGGLNCTEWCYEQLEVAGVDDNHSKPKKPWCVIS